MLLALSVVVATPVSRAASTRPAHLEVTPRRATLATFTGGWIGHTRSLTIRRGGHASESIYSGCCDAVLNLTFRLSRPEGTWTSASATASVTGVWIRDRSAFSKAYRPPQVGEVRVLRLKEGVLTETLTRTVYCDARAENAGKCGA